MASEQKINRAFLWTKDLLILMIAAGGIFAAASKFWLLPTANAEKIEVNVVHIKETNAKVDDLGLSMVRQEAHQEDVIRRLDRIQLKLNGGNP